MKHLLLPALLLFLSQFSFAQETASVPEKTSTLNTFETFYDTIKNKNKVILKEIVITTNKPTKPITALRSGLKPMDVPQSIQVVGAEIIEQQQAIRLSEVLKNANGVYVGSARGGAQESFYSRGYDMSANNMFKNGFRYNAGSIPEVSGLEKVEFLKGGSALLFGNVAPGGILNLVTKTPSFKSGGEISMQTGSYSYYKPSIDFYGPLNKFIAYRINGSYENSESYRDVVKNERIYINPSLLFNVTNTTQITLQGDYLSADWTPDFGTGAIGKEIAKVSRKSYFGALWSNGQTKSTSASVLVNHDFNKNWMLNFNSSFQSYDRQSFGTERIQPNDEKNEILFGDTNRPLGKNKNLEQIFGNQLSLQGCFKTGSIKHQLFTGADWENSLATGYTFTFSEKAVSINNDGKYVVNYYDTINLFSYDPATQRKDIPKNVTNTRIVTTNTNRFGIYAQDLISFTEKIKLLVGIRWSWQESQADTNNLVKKTITEGAKRLDNAFSPKVGLVYQPTKDMSLFASYSNSFTPNTGTTVDLQPIKPSIIDQYEAGIKKDFWKGLLSTNITVYQITNSNLAQTAEFKADGTTLNIDTTIKTLSGETKSKGVEIDVTARPIEGLNIIAGYSYNDMRYSKTTGANGSFIEGDRLVRTPENTANLSFFYTLQSGALKGMSFGAIGNYIGDRLGGWNNQYDVTKPNGIWDREIPLEDYTTIDASVGYNWKKFSILCKLSNITNELNYTTVHENYSVNPIAPRQIMTSLKYKF
ncbi:TonB-dependent siderophore receptor [Flavobacterium franklandianum]|uniref:TonB-dependent siderophore receptor n=1 Tax=Flavobacterium franklandianum TaxID=2594430 RepID=A0A553CJP2_9FLAO|nr:TonB-dependent siderophore receptor [Flavobacterium franklandianum]TRX20708.1 TonB-dependent siderophore receptor [Flavobacterium franklandianum]